MDTAAVFNDDYLYFYAERLDSGAVRRAAYSVRLFAFTELRDWLSGAGLTGVEGYGDGGGPLTMESRRMVVTARR